MLMKWLKTTKLRTNLQERNRFVCTLFAPNFNMFSSRKRRVNKKNSDLTESNELQVKRDIFCEKMVYFHDVLYTFRFVSNLLTWFSLEQLIILLGFSDVLYKLPNDIADFQIFAVIVL